MPKVFKWSKNLKNILLPLRLFTEEELRILEKDIYVCEYRGDWYIVYKNDIEAIGDLILDPKKVNNCLKCYSVDLFLYVLHNKPKLFKKKLKLRKK